MASSSSALPDGMWSTTAPIPAASVVAAIKAAGQDPSGWPELGTEKTVVFTLRFQAGVLDVFAFHDGVPDSGSWSGTFRITDDHTFVATYTGSPPSVQTYHFTVVGDQLTMEFVSDTETDAFELAHATGIYNTAPFIRQATAAAPSIAPTTAPATSSAAFEPTLVPVPCPADVSVQILQQPACSQLTVLEDRSNPDGRRIQLLVVRVDPPGGTTPPDPIVVVGSTLATEIDYGGTAPVGQRTHRVAYLVDLRGIGHSQPNLDCPEVRAASPALLGLRQQDPAYATTFLKAVQACHDRLTGQGVDLAAYDLASSAADIEDLRIALKVPGWNIVAYGSATRVAVEVARRYPDHVRALVLSSPLLPGADPFSGAATSTHDAIAGIAAACTADAVCHSTSPDLGASIDKAVARLDATPVTVTAASSAGASIPIMFDGATLVRALRDMIGASDGAEIASHTHHYWSSPDRDASW